MLLVLLAAAALAFTGLSALRGGGFALWRPEPVTEEPTMPPVPLPAQFGRAGQLRYHYGNLGEDEKIAYDDILARLPGFPESVKVKNLDSDALNRVFSALVMDQPLLFQISTTHYKTRTTNGTVTAFCRNTAWTRTATPRSARSWRAPASASPCRRGAASSSASWPCTTSWCAGAPTPRSLRS